MQILAAATQTQPDYVALAMVVAFLLFVAVAALRKRFAPKKAKQEPTQQLEPQPAEPVAAELAPGSAGQLKLHNVEPKVAAMAMAIVAHKMGKPLNELRFISIKEVTEE